MAQSILLKRSSVAGNVPDSSDLSLGEIAINTADGAVYIKKGNNDIVAVHDNDILHIDTTNSRIGIGTTNPGYKLDVNGQIHSTAAYIDGYIYHTGDSDTYINYSTDNIILSAGGPVMHIKGSGKVGIGTSSPSEQLDIESTASVNLELNNTGNSVSLKLGAQATAARLTAGPGDRLGLGAGNTADYMTIASDGKVGIGTTSPATTLEVVGENVRLRDASSGTYFQAIDTDGSHNAGYFMRSGSNNWYNLVDTAGKYQIYDGDASSIRLIIDGSGNVGIGTTSPSRRLSVVGGTAGFGNGTIETVISYSDRGIFGTQSNHDLEIRTNGSEAMRIDSSGNVGIGTDNPISTLHVKGDGKEIYLSSADHNVARIIPRGGTGTNLDKGLFSLFDTGTEDIRLDTAGNSWIDSGNNLGIGTKSPGSLLTVEGDIRQTTGDLLYQGGGNWDIKHLAASQNILFYTTPSGGSATERMRISSTGTVSIGTTSTTYQFNLQGSGDTIAAITAGASSVAGLNLGNTSDKADGGIRYDNGTNTLFFRAANNNIVSIDSSGNLNFLREDGLGIRAKESFIITIDSDNDDTGRVFQVRDGSGTVHQSIAKDTGAITFNSAYTFPTADGSANQVLKTDGSGNLTFATVAGASGGTSISDSDGDTKIQVEESSDEDIIRFDTAGSQRMMINNIGRVGINTTALSADGLILGTSNSNCEFDMIHTSGKRYRINNLASGNFQIENKTDGGTPLAITSAGRVGIGITAPSTKFQVKSTGSDDGVYLVKSDNTNLLGGIIQTGSGDGALVARNTSNSQTVLFRGQGNNYITGGSLAIGHTSPAYQLHVAGAGDILVEDNTGGSAHLRLKSSASGTTTSHWKLKTNAANHFYIDNDQQGTTNLTILSGGNVGIGTTSPSFQFHVLSTIGTRTLSLGHGVSSGTITTDAAKALNFQQAGSTKMTLTSGGNLDLYGNMIIRDTAGTRGIFRNDDAYDLRLGGGVDMSDGAFISLGGENRGGSTSPARGKVEIRAGGNAFANQAAILGDIVLGASWNGGTADILTLDSSSGNITTSGNISLTSNSTYVAARSILARDTNGLSLSTTNATAAINIDNSANVTMPYNLTVTGNLTVNGTQTTLNTANLNVEDKLITIADGAADASAANESGINVDGANAQILYKSGNDRWEFNKEAFSAFGFMVGTTSTDVGLMRNSSGVFDFQAQSTRQISFSNATNGEHVRIDANGKVGIGITAPTAALSVVDTSQTTTGQGLAGLRVHRPNATSQYGYVDYDNGGGGINVGSFYSGGGNSVYGTFMFRQHNAAGSQTPMAIGNTGNVGIATTSPADKLHIQTGNLLFERGVELRSKDTGGNLRTIARVNSSNELEYGWSASGPVKFMGGTSYTERMRVHTNGNIGINTTSPTHKLHVAGDIRIDSGSALKLYNAAGNGWAELRLDNSSNQVTLQRTFRTATDLAYNLGTPSYRWGFVYARNLHAEIGLSSDGGIAKKTVWRAIDNSSTGGTKYVKICRVTASQSARFTIELSGRSTGYGDGNKPAYGMLIGQLNNDDNYDFTYYNYHSGTSEAVTEVGQVDIDTLSTDIYVKIGSYCEVVATGTISDGTIFPTTGNTGTGQGSSSAPTGYAAISEQRVIIENAAGNVGIGTTTPSKPLHVQFSGDHGARIESEDNHASLYIDSHTSYGQYIRFTEENNNKYWINSTGGKLVFRPAATGTEANQVAFDASGNVGIGTTTPSEKLEVNGTIRAGVAGNSSTNVPALKVYASGATNSAKAAIAIQQGTSEGDTIIFADYDPYVEYGISAQNSTDQIHFTAGDSTNSLGSKTVYNGLGNSRTAYIKFNVDLSDGKTLIGGDTGIGTNSPNTRLHVYENVNRTSAKVQNNNHSAIFEAYGNATAIDSDASNGIFLRISGSNKVHVDNNGNVGVGKDDPSAKFQVEEYGIDTTSTSSSATTQIAIHTFAAATFRSARFTVQVTNSTDSTYHTTELLLVHDGTTANITEFGEIHTGSAREATFDADINSGNVRLLATPASTDTMTFKVVCHSITA